MKKILVVGDVEGNFDYLTTKIEQLQEKGQVFNLIFCVGQTLSLTFDISKYINKTQKLPQKIYFIDSSELSQCLHQKFPDGSEICPNLVFLGKAGIKEIEGFQIAYISGQQSKQFTELYSENNFPKVSFYGSHYTLGEISLIEQTIKNKKEDFKGVDIFLSNDWPLGFDNNIQKLQQDVKTRSIHIAKLVDQLCPRYHFVAQEDIFFKRQPYINNLKFNTRLISLGKLSGKQQYLSAFQMIPITQISEQDLKIISEDSTSNPYSLNVSGSFLQENLIQEQQLEEEEEEGKVGLEREKQGKEHISMYPQENQEQAQQKSVGNQNQLSNLTENPVLFVKNFDLRSTSDDISEFIARWGETDKVELFYDERTKSHKGYCLVTYKDLKTAQSALQESGKYSLHGRKIYFQISRQQQKQPPPKKVDKHQNAKCWFCYNSDNIDRSLIFYEEENIYLALDKGPIFNEHFLIIPKSHTSNYMELDSQTQGQIEHIKKRMNQMFIYKQSKALICFERYMKLSNNVSHMIMQCVPVDLKNILGFVEQFEKGVKVHKLDFFKISQDEKIEKYVGKSEFYFYLESYNQNMNLFDRYLYAFKEGTKFPYDFGRQILCEIFSVKKTNWKECQLMPQEIAQQVEELKINLNYKKM